MLGLGWNYKWGCLRLLVMQGALLVLAITTLRITGYGIDLVHALVQPSHPLPPAPWGLAPPKSWPPMGQVALVAGLVLVCELFRGGLNYAYALTAGRLIHTRIVPELRSRVYDKLQRLSFRFFDANATGSIINRVTADVQSTRAFIDGVLIQLVLLAVSLLCYLAYMLSLNVTLTLACLATTPLMWLVTVIFSRMVRPLYDHNRELVDRVILRLAESIQGVQVIKGFGREREEIARFAADNRAVQDQQQGIFWRVSIFGPTIGYMTQINLVILLAYGGWLVTQDKLALGSGLVVFAGLLQQFSSQVANLTNIANSVQQSLSGARRVFEILDTPITIESKPGAVKLQSRDQWSRSANEPRPLVAALLGRIEFDHVWFEYTPGNPVLRDVTFTIEPGQKVAILGATGAGKSSLLSLLCRFYDPTQGAIRLDGHDLRDLDLDDLRRNIGLVFQESFLFSNTVAANIAFGHPDATVAQVERAAKIAAAHEFIAPLPHGYDTVLGEGGLDLSGGQRQRLAIARAVLLDPAILLLDDPAAAIDPHTEHEILAAMDQAMQGRTTLVIAHRLSTLRQCDRVIVLDQGRIAQLGTHAELLAAEGHYRHAARSQLAGAGP
ncbi:MAG: ABC transporter ATP-binding protein [Pirellulaceae bacterium]|nr:ABC transporter ATP-binding protein [Pirellulaceae bacterium]